MESKTLEKVDKKRFGGSSFSALVMDLNQCHEIVVSRLSDCSCDDVVGTFSQRCHDLSSRDESPSHQVFKHKSFKAEQKSSKKCY